MSTSVLANCKQKKNLNQYINTVHSVQFEHEKNHEKWVELYQNRTTERERTGSNTECTKALPMGDSGGSVAILH